MWISKNVVFIISSSIVLYRLNKVISRRLLGNNWIFLIESKIDKTPVSAVL